MQKNHNLICRQLNESDSHAYYEACLNRKRLFGNSNSLGHSSDTSILDEKDIKEKLKSDQIRLGIFNDKKLIAGISLNLWKRIPYYTVYDLYIVDGRPLPYYQAVDILFRKIFELMEERFRFTFYMVTKLRSLQMAEFKQHKTMDKITKDVRAFDRYNMSIEDIIEPGKKPEYGIHSDLILNNIWDCPVLVRVGQLKQEHRMGFLEKKLLNLSSSQLISKE